jgi:hypothetical protein
LLTPEYSEEEHEEWVRATPEEYYLQHLLVKWISSGNMGEIEIIMDKEKVIIGVRFCAKLRFL